MTVHTRWTSIWKQFKLVKWKMAFSTKVESPSKISCCTRVTNCLAHVDFVKLSFCWLNPFLLKQTGFLHHIGSKFNIFFQNNIWQYYCLNNVRTIRYQIYIISFSQICILQQYYLNQTSAKLETVNLAYNPKLKLPLISKLQLKIRNSFC